MEALVGSWKFINMPTPRPKRAKVPSIKLKDYITGDENGEWIFETPEGGDRPSAESAQESSASMVRGIKTPSELQMTPVTNENETRPVDEILENQPEAEISVVENGINISVGDEGEFLVRDGMSGMGEQEGGDEGLQLTVEMTTNNNEGTANVITETSGGLVL